MTKIFNILLGFITLIGSVILVLVRQKSPTPIEKEEKVKEEIKAIKEKVDATPLDDLVAQSNQRYGPGTGTDGT